MSSRHLFSEIFLPAVTGVRRTISSSSLNTIVSCRCGCIAMMILHNLQCTTSPTA